MSLIKNTLGTSTTTVITLAALAASTAGAGRECTVIDNSSNLYLDAMLYIACKVASGTIGMDKSIYVYLYGSEDGANFEEVMVTGTDAAITFNETGNNLRLGGVLSFGTSTTGNMTQKMVIPSVAAVFGGVLPRKWGFVIKNATNIALSSTEGDHVHTYTGLYQSVE